MAHYPNAHFIKDHVFITFGVREGLRLNGDRVDMVSGQRTLLIRPIGWLYEGAKPASSQRFPDCFMTTLADEQG